MPKVAPPKPHWICCCDYDPPGLRCPACSRGHHRDCSDKRLVSR